MEMYAAGRVECEKKNLNVVMQRGFLTGENGETLHAAS